MRVPFSKEQILLLHDGDLKSTVRMLATARMIREHHKKARITLLTGKEFAGLLKHAPYFNEVEPSLKEMAGRGFFERRKRARASKLHRVYDLGSGEAGDKIKSALRFSSTRWINLAEKAEGQIHPMESVAMQLGKAGIGPKHYEFGEALPPSTDWVDFVAKQSRTLDPAYFGIQGRYVLFAPAGDDVVPALRWPKERWASLAHELSQLGVEPAVVGGPSVRELGRYIAHVTPGTKDLTGRANLVQLAGLGRNASFAFGEDIGLLHLLVASGTPSVMFHPGMEPPHYSAPRGNEPTLLMHAPTLAQIPVIDAVRAMKFAGGFNRTTQAA